MDKTTSSPEKSIKVESHKTEGIEEQKLNKDDPKHVEEGSQEPLKASEEVDDKGGYQSFDTIKKAIEKFEEREKEKGSLGITLRVNNKADLRKWTASIKGP